MSNDDETANYYDVVNQFVAELWDANFHQGYWESDADQSSNREAADKLTDLVIERSGDVSGARVLDVGCGFGLPAFRLADKEPSVRVVGISNNRSQVEGANRRSADLGLANRVTFDYADALTMPYEDNSFDVVWVVETLPHLDRLAALREFNRVVKPGGRVVITDMFLNAEPSPEELAELRAHEARTAMSPRLLEHEYREVVEQSGLRLQELKDISAETRRSAFRMLEAVNERYDEIIERYTERILPIVEAVRNPARRRPELGYLIAVARKAD